MIKFELLEDAGLLIVEPRDPLTAEDFRMVSRTVDPYICNGSGCLDSFRGGIS